MLAKDPIDLYCAKRTEHQTVPLAMTLAMMLVKSVPDPFPSVNASINADADARCGYALSE